MHPRLPMAAILAALLLISFGSYVASAAPGGNSTNVLKVTGTEWDPGRICDANAAWIKGIGLSAADDPRAYGFLMHKLCSTPSNAAAFGVISGVKGEALVSPLGFDYKDVNNGFIAHCGAGAPRFNVTMSDGSFHFLGGCANGTHTTGSPVASGWTRVRIDPQADNTQAFPAVPTNATIVSIALVYDEGSDQDPNGSPEIVLDNIFINGKTATSP
jgi:hypothetical protein